MNDKPRRPRPTWKTDAPILPAPVTDHDPMQPDEHVRVEDGPAGDGALESPVPTPPKNQHEIEGGDQHRRELEGDSQHRAEQIVSPLAAPRRPHVAKSAADSYMENRRAARIPRERQPEWDPVSYLSGMVALATHPTILHLVLASIVGAVVFVTLAAGSEPPDLGYTLLLIPMRVEIVVGFILLAAAGAFGGRLIAGRVFGHHRLLNFCHGLALVLGTIAVGYVVAVAMRPELFRPLLTQLSVVAVAVLFAFVARSLRLIGVWERSGPLRAIRYTKAIGLALVPVLCLLAFRFVVVPLYAGPAQRVTAMLESSDSPCRTVPVEDGCDAFLRDVAAETQRADRFYFEHRRSSSGPASKYAQYAANLLQSQRPLAALLSCDHGPLQQRAQQEVEGIWNLATSQAATLYTLAADAEDLAPFRSLLSRPEFMGNSPFTAAHAHVVDRATGDRMRIPRRTEEALLRMLGERIVTSTDWVEISRGKAPGPVDPACAATSISERSETWRGCAVPLVEDEGGVRRVACVWQRWIRKPQPSIEYHVAFQTPHEFDRFRDILAHDWPLDHPAAGCWRVGGTEPPIVLLQTQSELPGAERQYVAKFVIDRREGRGEGECPHDE